MNNNAIQWASCLANSWLSTVADKLNANQGIVEILGVLVAIGLSLLVFRWPWRAWGVAFLLVSIALVSWLILRPPPCCVTIDGFKMAIPNVLTVVSQDDHEAKLADADRQNWVTLWTGHSDESLQSQYDGLAQKAKIDPNPYLRPPSKGYFVVSWETSDGIDHYEAGISPTTGPADVHVHLQINAHTAGNPLTERKYEQMLDSLLTSAGIKPPVRHVKEGLCGAL